VFTPCCEPYLASEYGGDYDTDSPVKLLDKLLYGMKQTAKQQVVLLSQVRLLLSIHPLSCPGHVVCSCISAGSRVQTKHPAPAVLPQVASFWDWNAESCLLDCRCWPATRH
jgi:PDZ domain